MMRALRSFALVALAASLGVFQACACAHEAGHSMHAEAAASAPDEAHPHHTMHGPAAVTPPGHEESCGTAAPECDHAPDASVVIAKANIDLASKIVQPASVGWYEPSVLAERRSLHAVGQTGPPQRGRSRRPETPVTLKVLLLA